MNTDSMLDAIEAAIADSSSARRAFRAALRIAQDHLPPDLRLVGSPGTTPQGDVRAADVIIRVNPGEPVAPFVGRITSEAVWSSGTRWDAEASGPGFYASVTPLYSSEAVAVPRARRMLDSRGRVPRNQILLRPVVASPAFVRPSGRVGPLPTPAPPSAVPPPAAAPPPVAPFVEPQPEEPVFGAEPPPELPEPNEPDVSIGDEPDVTVSEACEEGFSRDDAEAEQPDDAEDEPTELAPAGTIDEIAAQPAFPSAVRDRVGPLLDARRTREASAWNSVRHPGKSGIDTGTLQTRFDQYLNRAAIEQAMRASAELKDLADDPRAVLAVVANQFQQKIYASAKQQDGKIGEGTLDALGFVRHRDSSLNAVDASNEEFHVRGKSQAFARLKEVYGEDRNVFQALGVDVSPSTWYRLFVNAPFLGRPFYNGIHVELMRRLRQAEKWLLGRPPYRGLSPVELGIALGIDEDHHGGRSKNTSSMHTLGLAADIRYTKNPWVSGQADAPTRNKDFRDVSENVSRLLTGKAETLTSRWLNSLGTDPDRTTESAHSEILERHARFQQYLALEIDANQLRAVIRLRTAEPGGDRFLEPNETIDDALTRWRGTIKADRAKLQHAFGSNRDPRAGFLNLHRDLVVALRDHGCLAWGAIDLGSSQTGDMMHFDCRADGIGWKLALEIQRTGRAGRACQSSVQSEAEDAPAASSAAARARPFLGGLVWTFTATVLPLRVAVFCPKAARSLRELDVLVYAHGLLGPCRPVPKSPPEDFITKAPFELGKLVDASTREMVLAVPFMDWEHLASNHLASKSSSRRHALGMPANLNALVAEVLAEVADVQGAPAPSLGGLLLAGHSRAYDFLDPLAAAHGDPEMAQGALASLRHVWALDTTYTCPTDDWNNWLASKPQLTIEVLYRKGSKTDCGRQFSHAVKQGGGRLRVTSVAEEHCEVPGKRLPDLLAALSDRSAREAEEAGSDEGIEADQDAGEVSEDEEFDFPKSGGEGDEGPRPSVRSQSQMVAEAETFTPDADDRFVVLVSGYNYFAKSDDYAVLARNRARVVVAQPQFENDDHLVFVWFSVADGRVFVNRRRAGAWKLRDKRDWTAIDEFEFASTSSQPFAFEAVTDAKHYKGDTKFRQADANSVMSIVDIYRFLANLGIHRKGRLMEFSILSHGFWDGPILVNTKDGMEGSDTRDASDKDCRGRKDFNPANLTATVIGHIQDSFHADGFSWIWGCFASKAPRAVIQGVADSTTRKTSWGKRVRGLNGATYRADGTTPDTDEFRFTFGRTATEEYSKNWDSSFFPTGVESFDKTFDEIKAFAKKHADDTYCHALAAGTQKPCFGPPPGASTNYAARDPYRPGTPVVHWVERGKKRPSPEAGSEANYDATIEFFVNTMKMPEDPEMRGYIRYDP